MRESLHFAGVVVDVAERLPVAGGVIGAVRTRAQQFVGDTSVWVATTTRSILGAVIREVVEVLTEEVDLTDLMLNHVDLERLIAEVLAVIDLDAVIETVDLDRAVAQVDLMKAIGLVDLDEVIGKVDLDAVAAKLDIDAVLDRVDLVELAEEIIDGVDLPDIIREASTSVTADVMTDVRSTSERADDAVANAVNRFLRRRAAETVDEHGRDGGGG
ncbi:hypothetical protein [Gordonia amicalis]|uniref:hypothetical protein n=1 Tax=Gordonia amicalis TaxID=89053 RepID=UPI0022A7B8DC|nr:hypothetical protein [Gordonia amicalis]MCZ0912035.1 hypothetical protein [Gordonia amicalis]MDJ0454016.1 hypothetical protein [Gordonia amicalis]MDV7077164.1 hypothetical protein [Gordonia amicalis]